MSSLISAGLLFIFLGIALIILGGIASMIRGVRRDDSNATMRGGGIIMLGPIPIVFGSDRGTVKSLIVLALVLMAAYLLVAAVISLFL